MFFCYVSPRVSVCFSYSRFCCVCGDGFEEFVFSAAAMETSVKAETPEAKPPSKKKRPSGKSNWKSINQQRKDRAMAAARQKQGLPVTRLRNKQAVVPRRSGRVVQRAVRVEDDRRQCSVGTQAVCSWAPEEILEFRRAPGQCLPTRVDSSGRALGPERAASAYVSEGERATSASLGDQACDERAE